MTLVAGLSVGGLPAFVGDLLTSRNEPSEIELPTTPKSGVYPCADGYHAAGLAQKLVIVRPYLMVAWAGSYLETRRIVRELDAALPNQRTELNSYNVAFDILNTCSDGTEIIALFISENAIQPFGVRTRGFELSGRRIYLLGSGATDFFQYLEDHPDFLPHQERADGQIARAILLRFACQSFTWQWITSFGLGNAWGGGFEVAFPEKDGFKKINNILFRGWLLDEDGDLHNSGRSFFSRYYGGDLYLSCFAPDEKTYVVPALLGESVPAPRYEEVRPEWTVDSIVVKATEALVDFVRYQPPHRPVDDLVQLSEGHLVGWRMDKEYVDQCARRAASVGATRRTTFDITRY